MMQVVCDNLEGGGDGMGGGKEVQEEGNICIIHGWLMSVYSRNQHYTQSNYTPI